MVWWMTWAAAFAAGTLPAQVPPDIATKLIAIGRGVCVPETAELYAPLHAKPPYAGVKFNRDVSFGPDAKNVLDVAEPLAYCLPGVRSRVVVSEGTLNNLTNDEVAAILTHERAHLRARHDLVLEAFTAVHAAFPRLVRSSNALGAVQLLVELLADDAAVRAAGRTPLARALVACASGRAPSGALAAGGPSTVVRVRRLSGRGNSPMLSAAAYLAAAAVLVVPTVALAVPWLTELKRLFNL